MDKAHVSVIITCHDLERYLDECVESIQSQTVLPEEIIIVHDFCEHPKGYAQTTTVIRDKHLGVAKSRDEGVRLSAQPLLLFVDGDDVLPELFLQEMIATMQKGVDIAYPDALLWSRWGDSGFENGWYNPPNRLTPQRMMVKNEVLISSLMKRKVYEAVGGFDPSLEIFEDYKFWLLAMAKGFKFAKANTYLKYRQRKNSRNHQDDELKRSTYDRIKAQFEIREGKLYQKHPSHL